MKIEKSKNASRNIIFGVLLKVYQILVPFLMRTIMMYAIGVQYLGLNSLFTSILQVLNLAELGVGSAMVFSMYKPIACNDETTICALMKLYRLYYRVIGGVILVVGMLLVPFLPRLIAEDVPANINIYYLYILNLLATVLTYWLFAYRNSILQAYQRQDLVSKVTLCTDTVKYLLQIMALVIFKNYYFYVVSVLITQILNNVATAIISRKAFPQYRPTSALPKQMIREINGKIRDLFTSKLGYTIVSSADTIVISAFLGLTILAKYQNYYFILSSIIGFVAIVYSSITAGVGNSMLTKSLEQNYKEFEVFTLLVSWVSGICISCFLALYQPFMMVWMGKDMLLDFSMVIMFCIYFWVYEIVMMISVYKDAGGIWHEDRYRPLISGIVNLILNVILVKFIGLYGVVLSTILSVLFISAPWIIKNVFKLIFKSSPKKYVLKLCWNTLWIFISASVSFFASLVIKVGGFVTIIGKGIIAISVFNLIFVTVIKRDENYDKALTMLLKVARIKK